MGRLTERDGKGNWCLRGMPWWQFSGEEPLTQKTRSLLYGALFKLKDYEDTGLTPDEIMDGKLLTGWIPISERRPEDGQIVLVCNPNEVYMEEYSEEGLFSCDSPVAWMPLPEVYKP